MDKTKRKVTWLDKTTINLNINGQQEMFYYPGFNMGDEVIVNWNGIEYECKIIGFSKEMMCVGNLALYDGQNIGEVKDTKQPFLFMYMEPATFVFAEELGEVTFEATLLTAYEEEIKEYNDGLPADFPRFTVKGESISTADILMTPHTSNFRNGYIFILDYQGNVKWYKNTPSFCYNFKQFLNSNNEIRYAYMISDEYLSGTYELCHGVIMNDKMKVINDNIRLLEAGSIKNGHALECHTFTILDENHYILTAIDKIQVNNIPGLEGQLLFVYNNIIQEQKDGKVLWHFETIDYPELYGLSIHGNMFEDGIIEVNAADYAHINSISRDKEGNILACFRHIGLVKINYQTKEIMWILGPGRNDIANITKEDLPYLQHDVRYMDDGSFIIFDNSGCPEDHTRLCRYWINDETKINKKTETLITNYRKSIAMGYAELIDNEVYDITYGVCIGAPAFEEYDFKNQKQNMSIKFNNGHDLYNISRAIHNYEAK